MMLPAASPVFRWQVASGDLDAAIVALYPEIAASWAEAFSGLPVWYQRYQDEFLLAGLEPECGAARRLLAPLAAAAQARLIVAGTTEQDDRGEVGIFGGAAGLTLAQRFFAHDSDSCAAWLALERAGSAGIGRREFSLLLTERLLAQSGCSAAERSRFYAIGWDWATRDGSWTEDDLVTLRRRAHQQRAPLAELLDTAARGAWPSACDARAVALADRFLASNAPLLAAYFSDRQRSAGSSDPVAIAWSLLHRHCNRLGIPGLGEAVLRYLVHTQIEGGATA